VSFPFLKRSCDFLSAFDGTGEKFNAVRSVIPLRDEELADKIIRFGEEVAAITLYQYQRSFALCVVIAVLQRNGDEPSALYSRQSGKSEVVAVISLALCILMPCLALAYPDDSRVRSYAKGFRVGCYGPKQDKAEIVYKRVRKYASEPPARALYQDPEIDTQLTVSRGNICAWSNGSICQAGTASENVDNEGATWHLLIIDEAQRISANKIKKQLRPTLGSTNGPLVMIGTALAASAYFMRAIQDNIKSEKDTGKRLHFEYPYDKVISERRALYDREVRRYEKFQRATPKVQATMLLADPRADREPDTFHLDYENYVAREIRTNHGDLNDPSFKMNFRLLWQEGGSTALSQAVIYAGAVPNVDLNQFGVTGHIVAGLDVAKGKLDGSDQSVLTIMHVDTDNPIMVASATADDDPLIAHHKTFVGIFTFRGEFEEDGQYEHICNALAGFPTCLYLKVDSTGIGDPVCERLAVLLPHMTVSGLRFNTTSKANGYKGYLIEWNAGRIHYGAGPNTVGTKVLDEFVGEHEGLQRVIKQGITTYEAPPGEHDDYTDSGMLCNIAVGESMTVARPMEVVEATQFGQHASSQCGDGPRSRAARYKRGRMGPGRRR